MDNTTADTKQIKKEKQRAYLKTFVEKNQEKYAKKFQCPICGGTYTYVNKFHHNKSKKHQIADLKNKLQDFEKNA